MSQGTFIHPSAIVEKGAELGTDVYIGPYTIIGPKVKIGDRTHIKSHGVLDGRTHIGADNKIWSFVSLGTQPQDLKYRGEDTVLEIGDHNMIREYVNISIGTDGGGGVTHIGSHNLLMVNVHIAHDCIVADHCVFANGVSLAGHVCVDSRAILGGHSAFHQFTRIGLLAMIGGGSIVVQDVAPFCMVQGNHAALSGLNQLGIKRFGFSKDEQQEIKAIYKTLFQSDLPLEDAKQKIETDFKPSSYKNTFLTFLNQSTRGLCR